MNPNAKIGRRAGVAIIAVVLIGIATVGYLQWNRTESYMEPDTWVEAARKVLEKPERERMQAEGKSAAEIDVRIAKMWDRGELKLPDGEPGVDWTVDPGHGIRMLPGPEELRRNAIPPAPSGPTQPAPASQDASPGEPEPATAFPDDGGGRQPAQE